MSQPTSDEDAGGLTSGEGVWLAATLGFLAGITEVTLLASAKFVLGRYTHTGDVPVDIQRSSHGPVLGAVAGWGATWNRFYGGIEAEADFGDINWNIERDPNGRVYSAQHEYSFGGAIRAGWLISDSALLYARAGAVRTHFDIPYATTNRSVRSRETETGYRLGGGLEIGVGGRVRLRLDYTMTDYGRYDVVYGQNSDSFEHSESLLRVGLLWRL